MKRRMPVSLLLSTVMLIVAAAFTSDALTQVSMSVEPDSRLWIEGTSTVSAFTCEASTLDGEGRLSIPSDARASVASGAAPDPVGHLAVPVQSFDCGRQRMNADFYEALKSDQHSEIQFELTSVGVQDDVPTDEWNQIRVEGLLTIAGTTRTVDLIASWRREGANRFRVTGSKALTMTSFGVRPPVALLGLVRARDDIEVHFDLIAEARGL